MPVEVDGQPLDVLADDAAALHRAPEATGVRLLGPFDLFLQGRDRELVVPDEAARKDLWRTLGRPGGVLDGHEVVGHAGGRARRARSSGSRSTVWSRRRAAGRVDGASRTPGRLPRPGVRRVRRSGAQSRSRISAMPWPPPTHMVIRPVVLSCQSRRVEHRVLQPGAGHAERVADRDRAAVDVEPVEVDAEVLVGRHHLRGERLVDLDQVDVADASCRRAPARAWSPRPGRGP